MSKREREECMLNRKLKIAVLFFIIASVSIVLGCAERSKELLVEDYKNMNNEELLRYFYRMNDEIERQEKQQDPQVSFGLGSSGLGPGIGAGVSTGNKEHTADELRARKIDIRLELNRRGLNPEK